MHKLSFLHRITNAFMVAKNADNHLLSVKSMFKGKSNYYNVNVLYRILLIGFFQLANSYVQANEFLKAFGDLNGNIIWSATYVQETESYYAIGSDINGTPPFIIRLDKNGNIIWSQRYAGSLSPTGIYQVKVAGQNVPDLIVSCMGDAGSGTDIHILRIRATDGTVVWSYQYLPSETVRYTHVAITTDDKIIANGVNFGNSGMFFMHIDISGNVVWAKRYTSSRGQFGVTSTLEPDPSGGVICTNRLGQGTAILNLDGNGNIKRFKEGNQPIIHRSIIPTGTSFLLAGAADFNNRGINNTLVKIDTNLNVVFSKNYNSPTPFSGSCSSCDLQTAVQLSDGNILYFAESGMSGSIAQNVIKMTQNGDFIRASRYETGIINYYFNVPLQNGLFALVGTTKKSGLCIPGGQSAIFGVASDDTFLCETEKFTPSITNLNYTLSNVDLGEVFISNHPVTRNTFSNFRGNKPLSESPFCIPSEGTVVNLGPDIVKCDDLSITLNAGAGHSSYLWSNGATTPTILVTDSGSYSVTINTVCGTTSSDTIVIRLGKADSTNLSEVICEGDVFQFGNQTLHTTGFYIFETTTQTGCDSIVTLNLEVQEKPLFNLGPDTTICDGASLLLTVSIPQTTITWQNGSIVPSQTIAEPGVYFATAINDCGTAVDTIEVQFENCAPCGLFVPNAFTPNQDGVNDMFTPVFTCEEVKPYLFRVYNRWNELLFESFDPTIGWDGNYQGKKQPKDTYVYYVEYFNPRLKKQIPLKGTVTLLR